MQHKTNQIDTEARVRDKTLVVGTECDGMEVGTTLYSILTLEKPLEDRLEAGVFGIDVEGASVAGPATHTGVFQGGPLDHLEKLAGKRMVLGMHGCGCGCGCGCGGTNGRGILRQGVCSWLSAARYDPEGPDRPGGAAIAAYGGGRTGIEVEDR